MGLTSGIIIGLPAHEQEFLIRIRDAEVMLNNKLISKPPSSCAAPPRPPRLVIRFHGEIRLIVLTGICPLTM